MSQIEIVIMSFGFQSSGRPSNANKVLNARSVENPGTARQRQKHNGLNKDLAKDVLKQPKAQNLISEGVDSIREAISEFLSREVKVEDDVNNATTDEHTEAQEMAFILAVGCHAGMHRSVTIAEAIKKEVASFIKDENLKGNTQLSVVHRDINKHKSERR